MIASDIPTGPSSLHFRFILLALCAVLLWLPCRGSLAQTANANYTADLPSVARVKAEIKGSDPTDTLARQCAVFTYLQTYIDRIKYNRTVRGPYTPDEQRIRADYSLAAYQISQDYAKTHTPDEAKAFERLHGQYEMNSDFYKDWTYRLIGPQSAAAYKNMESEMGARQQAHIAAEKRTYEEAHAKTTNAQGLSNDPTAVATRRCLELGGSSIACMGKGFGAGFFDMIGFHPDELIGPGRAGVVLSGSYRNPATTTSLNFGPDTVGIAGCGKLVADGHSYTIEKRPGSLRVHVDNEPQPFVLTMRPYGGLTGPGPIDVKGRIIIGYHTITHTLYVNGAPAGGPQYGCTGVCSTSESVPDYTPKIERCTIGSLAMPPRPKPEAQSAAPDSGLMGTILGVFDTGEMKIPTEPGLRMTGQFASGKLLLDFTPTSIILDCGEAHVRGAYNVENATDQLLVHVDNPGGPFTLAVEPDNSLRGTASTTVNGRLVSGMQGENVTFTPHSETCEVGTFRPKTGSSATGSTTKIAANSPPPSAATPIAPSATTPSTSAPVAYAPTTTPALSTAVPPATPSTGIRAAMRVIITSNFAANTNPMAGQTIYIMRERMDDVLRKLGAPIPPNTSPAQAWQAFATACQGQGVDCTPLLTALKSHFVTVAKLDSAGKATLSATATTGAYFLFAQVRSPEGLMVWDLPATFVAGDNNVTLTPANAEHLR